MSQGAGAVFVNGLAFFAETASKYSTPYGVFSRWILSITVGKEARMERNAFAQEVKIFLNRSCIQSQFFGRPRRAVTQEQVVDNANDILGLECVAFR